MVYWAKISNILHGSKPTLLMILVQITLTIVNIGYKLALNDGMPISVLVAYRFMFGAAFIVPVAFFVERKKRPKLTRRTILYGFLCGLFGGALGQNLYLKSLDLTSATYISAMTNLVPAMTFVIAICLRLERLEWNSLAGKAKVFGTLLGIAGAMLLTFYKGPQMTPWKTNINLLQTTLSQHHHHLNKGQTPNSHNLVLGALLGIASCACYSLWLIIQAKAAEHYPCPYSITAMMTVWASIQGVVFALCTEHHDWSNWLLGWNIRLLTVVVAGILGSGMMFTLIAWTVRMRGPLFVSIFNPLLLVMVAIAGSLFLQEKLHLGMVLGGILIIGGLYVVLWGKGKELKKVSQLMPENQVVIDMQPPSPPLRQSSNSHGGSNTIKEEEWERKEEDTDSQTSEVLGALYMYHCP
ncbi:hypothetical protein ACS0TY_002044 [Phlomoides rotata]